MAAEADQLGRVIALNRLESRLNVGRGQCWCACHQEIGFHLFALGEIFLLRRSAIPVRRMVPLSLMVAGTMLVLRAAFFHLN